MTGNEVKKNLNSLFVSLVKKTNKVIICAVTLCNLLVVANIIACIHKRRIVNRVEPDCVAAEAFYIVKLSDDTLNVTDSVTVGVAKALRINFIENSVIKPVWHKKSFLSLFIFCGCILRHHCSIKLLCWQPFCIAYTKPDNYV